MLVNLLSVDEYQDLKDYCLHRYGVPLEAWANYLLVKTKDALWLINNSMFDFYKDGSIQYESAGLRCFSGSQFPYKITNGFYSVFREKITKRCLSVEQEDARELLKGGAIDMVERYDLPYDGYVLLFIGDTFFGIGLKKGDHLISQIPKSFRSQLGKNLEIRNE